MRKVIMILGLLLIGQAVYAHEISCSASGSLFSNGKSGYEQNDTAVFIDKFAGNCSDKHGVAYKLLIDGVGLGLKTSDGKIKLSCSNISKTEFEKGFSMSVFRVSAYFIYGTNLGIAIGHDFGVCILSGVELGVGASATFNRLKVAKGKVSRRDAEWLLP